MAATDNKVTDEKKEYEGFKNPETSKLIEMVGPNWRKGIAWPGVFEGKYCDITPKVAARLIEKKHPDFKLKNPGSATAKTEVLK